MKTKKYGLSVLGLMIAAMIWAIAFVPSSKTYAEEPEDDYIVVKELAVVSFASNEAKLYLDMLPRDSISHGYDGYVSLDDFKGEVTLNGQKFSDFGGIITSGGTPYRIYLEYGKNIGQGDKIVIPENTLLQCNDGSYIKFGCTFTVKFDGSSYSIKATSENVDKYEVDSVIIHPHSTTETMMYIMMATVDGNECITGYKGWVASDEATAELKESFLIRGEKMSKDPGITIQGMDIANALCISGYYMAEGDSIEIPEGTVFNNGKSELTFARTFTITWNGESYDVTRSARTFTFPEYEMPENMLSDFTDKSIIRLGGQSFLEAAVNKEVDCWNTNYVGFHVGRFVSEDEAPAGSTNGGYELKWEDTPGLFYTSIMFRFRDDITFNPDDEIVFNIYFSETIDPTFNLWLTSSLTPRIWEAQTIISGLSLKMGDWNEIHAAAADYLDENGKIAPIAFTLDYGNVYKGNDIIAGGKLVFDKATFVQTVKVLAEEPEILDVSAVIPVGAGKTFSGESDKTFDWTKESNMAFARTDKIVDGVTAKLTVNDIEHFSFFFVLNGVAVSYQSGGVYFWFGTTGIKVGTAQRIYIDEPVPAELRSNEAFTVEMKTIPYYVDGLKSGCYIELAINGNQIGEGKYISYATTNFGSWFGLYFHDFSDDVTVNVAPINQSQEVPISLTLSTNLNATTVKVGDSLGTRVRQTGKYYGAANVSYEVVSGNEFVTFDEDGYINGISSGEAVVRVSTTNDFGTYYSNELKITVTGGASQSTTPAENGCKSDIGGFGVLSLAMLGLAAVLKKRK